MKQIKAVLPYVLAVLIVVTGYFGLSGIEKLIPSYKDTVREFEKSDQNALFYFGKSEELVIYPWDTFDEAGYISGREEHWSGYEFMREGLLQWNMDLGNHTLLPGEELEFTPSIWHNGKNDNFFVKDYIYKNMDGEDCIISSAFNGRMTFYFHCEVYGNKDLTADEIRNGNTKINRYTQDLRNTEYTRIQGEEVPVGEGARWLTVPEQKENPLHFFIDRFASLHFLSDPYSIAKATPTVIPHKGDLLVIYYLEETQFILFYNPRTDLISGFSIK